uniref:Exonuclease 1 n=1 Tax=Erpetoichthys calabaricus TaxID=27687 RepID=A0A8C4T275_ERPCA
MGIQGLLQFIKDASEPVNVKKYKGQTVAVDTYCWLHKGAFSCAEKLAKGEPTDQYVTYCMKFVDMLLTYGVKPILVFDGCNLPSKKEVEKTRRERRQANLQKGKQLLREGKVSEARECFTRCVNITPSMAHEVIKAARARGVDSIVAPYEADAQLAFLNKNGIAQAVITEDSDLLAFGCKKVLLKMDKYGNGLEIDQAHLGRCKPLGDTFTEEKFRYMCILSGCDYLPSIHGIGLAKACKLLKMANNPDIAKVIKKIGQYLKMNVTVPDEYIEGFNKANNTFLYQLVFDPLSRKLVPLNPYADDIDPKSLGYAGHNIGDKAALQVALGNVDVSNMERIDNFNPDTAQPMQPKSRTWNENDDKKSWGLSIWSRQYSCSDNHISKPEAMRLSEKPSTRGIEKVINTRALKLTNRKVLVKRPREEETVSESDLLSQYCFSTHKKVKNEQSEALGKQEDHPADTSTSTSAIVKDDSMTKLPAPEPKIRNRFATILQRRNQEEGEPCVAGMKSRFFCNLSARADSTGKQSKTSRLEEQAVEDKNDSTESPDLLTLIELENKDAESSVSEPKESSPPVSPPSCHSSPSKCTSVFGWSGDVCEKSKLHCSPALLTLQQFQRSKEGTVYRGSQRSEQSPFLKHSNNTRKDDGLQMSESDDEDFDICRHSRGSSLSSVKEPMSSQGSLASSMEITLSQASQKTTKTDDLNSSQKMDASENSAYSPLGAEKTSSVAKLKAPGLQRVSPGAIPSSHKSKTLGPARASGLSKKVSALQKKKSLTNDENHPSLQITISHLWKKFEYKKEKEKIASPKKSKPMSPVKDNIPALTPETDKDIFNNPECRDVQRAIFCS